MSLTRGKSQHTQNTTQTNHKLGWWCHAQPIRSVLAVLFYVFPDSFLSAASAFSTCKGTPLGETQQWHSCELCHYHCPGILPRGTVLGTNVASAPSQSALLPNSHNECTWDWSNNVIWSLWCSKEITDFGFPSLGQPLWSCSSEAGCLPALTEQHLFFFKAFHSRWAPQN